MSRLKILVWLIQRWFWEGVEAEIQMPREFYWQECMHLRAQAGVLRTVFLGPDPQKDLGTYVLSAQGCTAKTEPESRSSVDHRFYFTQLSLFFFKKATTKKKAKQTPPGYNIVRWHSIMGQWHLFSQDISPYLSLVFKTIQNVNAFHSNVRKGGLRITMHYPPTPICNISLPVCCFTKVGGQLKSFRDYNFNKTNFILEILTMACLNPSELLKTLWNQIQ